jgi:hypothetical protein
MLAPVLCVFGSYLSDKGIIGIGITQQSKNLASAGT